MPRTVMTLSNKHLSMAPNPMRDLIDKCFCTMRDLYRAGKFNNGHRGCWVMAHETWDDIVIYTHSENICLRPYANVQEPEFLGLPVRFEPKQTVPIWVQS